LNFLDDDMTEITTENPIALCWEMLARQAAEWIAKNAQEKKMTLVYHPPVHGLDLETRKQIIEVRGDLIRNGKAPVREQKVIKKFYATLEVNNSRIVTP
jgi:hypothetical protein